VLARRKIYVFSPNIIFAIERKDFNILNFEGVDFNFTSDFIEEKKIYY